MTQGIYEIVNLQDGKASTYIGSSCDIAKRWVQHCSRLRRGCHPNTHLQAAWDKYGEGAFVFSVLEEVNEDMLLAMEQEYLDDYFDRGHCYNIAPMAGPGGLASEETKRKLSEALRGTQRALGHKHTEETRRRMSEARKDRECTEETKRKLSVAGMGHEVSEETRRRISEAKKGHKHTEETKRKLSVAGTGHKHTEETRHRISEALKGNQHTLGYKHTEETRRRISEAGAGHYPAFIHQETREVIPAGKNLFKLCKERGLVCSRMWDVKNGVRKSHHGWALLAVATRAG